MMKRKTKAAAVVLASVMACGLLAGCDLVTTDAHKDYEQVIGEVDISKSADFAEGGKYAEYADVISPAEITKRDMVQTFVTGGYSAMMQYGWTYKDTFEAITDSLVNRQVYVQYAEVYIFSAKNEDDTYKFSDEDGDPYTPAGYKAAVAAATGDKELAGLAYFLTEPEREKAIYDVRVGMNATIDSQEKSIIEAEEETDYDTDVRTTPTGLTSENEDYYDPSYRVYTGTQTSYGSYEPVDHSTVATRKKAYNNFLSNLRSNGLLRAKENTADVESLGYFNSQLRTAYENKIVEKLTDVFEEEGAAYLNETWMDQRFETSVTRQIKNFKASKSSFESALDGASNTSFVLAAPQANYGYVINILLPFNTAQSAQLTDAKADAGDKKGNKFVQRAAILKNILATDQRGTWFTGEEDYSFKATDGYGCDEGREYLFFEEHLSESEKYEQLENYIGAYTYNGTVTKNEKGRPVPKPTKIDIDGFIEEMEGYLNYVLGAETASGTHSNPNYFKQTVSDYYNPTTGNVDYSKFIYYQGKVNFGTFDPNRMFVRGEKENQAFSVINELSFAYNTDTAGLNPYLGYSVTPDKTNFVSEFEYAAQIACEQGAGSYVVVPSDYGWHVIYCTFSYTDANTAAFDWDWAQREEEGTFSYYYFEAMKANVISKYSSIRQTEIINAYTETEKCYDLYEDRYADLSGLDQA